MTSELTARPEVDAIALRGQYALGLTEDDIQTTDYCVSFFLRPGVITICPNIPPSIVQTWAIRPTHPAIRQLDDALDGAITRWRQTFAFLMHS